jgi:chaperonin GroEL
VEEGIVPGGGVALLNALPALDDVDVAAGDPTTGVGILRQALEAPMRKIAENAGKNGDVIIQNVRRAQEERSDPYIGYNVLTGEYENMIKAGIIDPAKVTRGALENAASIAAMILTTEALITDLPEEEKPMPAAPDMGGMGGMGGGMGF